MSFRLKIKYALVHTLKMSNKEAQKLLSEGNVEVNSNIITLNEKINGTEEIRVNGKIAVAKKEFIYLKFNKPKGFESTLNKHVKDNLSPFFAEYSGLAIAGRLDKPSEGLLLLSNDGKWIESICNPSSKREKEYLVELNRPPDAFFFEKFTEGVEIGKHLSQKCQCWPVSNTGIRVILTEGKNRQIRRMCWILGYEVVGLIRVRVGNITLQDLKPATSQKINTTFHNLNGSEQMTQL